MRKKEWRIQGKKVDFFGFARELSVSPMTVRLMCNRGLRGVEEMKRFMHPDVSQLYDPLLMKDMELAADILTEKISSGRHIRIVGDYDIDGVCSVAILYRGLCAAGANIDWYIPHRVKDGYGLNMRIIDSAIADDVDTILTCDNGISARAEVSKAKEAGLTVVITDHHDIPSVGVPRADAVVDPKQEDCHYPYKELCGASVAWKLVTAICRKMGLPDSIFQNLLEFAAIATVGDVVELMDENRLIVSLGLKKLPGTTIPGVASLIDECQLRNKDITSYHIGFVIGPCINAAGRLSEASIAEKLMLAKTMDSETLALARKLKSLNDERKDMTEKAVGSAITLVDNELHADSVLVLYLPDCGESIAGIVAGRIRERYYKPSIILTDSAADETMVKGSGRSIMEYSMFKELEKVSHLLDKFGGHPLAAGMSLKKENIDEFRRKLNEECRLTPEMLTEKIWIDSPLPISRLSVELVKEFGILEPYGKGNDKPVFAEKNLKILRARRLGADGQFMKLSLLGSEGTRMDGMLFSNVDEFTEELVNAYGEGTEDEMYEGFPEDYNPTDMSVIYYPSINEYRNVETVQIVITDFHFH